MKVPFGGKFSAGFSRSSGLAILAMVVLIAAGIIVLATYNRVPSGERSASIPGSPKETSPLVNPGESGGEAVPSRPDADEAGRDQQKADNGAPPAAGRVQRLAEFAQLIGARTHMVAGVHARMETIMAARATAGDGAQGHKTATGQAYRQAALAVEAALDAHPDVQALQAQVDALQEQIGEQSREQAGILDQWRAASRSVRSDFDAAVYRLSQEAAEAQRALLKAEDARSPAQLTASGQQRYQEIQSTLTNAVAQVATDFQQSSTAEAFEARREADGSGARFDELNAEMASIRSQQDALKQAMQARRDALRTQSPAIAALQEAARVASHQHLTAVQERPDVAEALAWVEGAEERQRELDARAYALYDQISTEFPDLRDELDALARQGGLVLTERAIRMASEQAGVASERKQP